MDIIKVMVQREAVANELYRELMAISDDVYLKWVKPQPFLSVHKNMLKNDLDEHMTFLFECVNKEPMMLSAYGGGIDQLVREFLEQFQLKIIKIHNRYRELLSHPRTINPPDEVDYNPIKWGVDKIKKLIDSGVINQMQAKGFICLIADMQTEKILWESSPWQLDLILNNINQKLSILKDSKDSFDYIINNFSGKAGEKFTRKNLITIKNKPRNGKNTDKKLSLINTAFDN